METPNKEVVETPPNSEGKEPEEGKKPEGEKVDKGEITPEEVTISTKEYEQLKMNKNLAANLQEENERLKRARKPGKKVVPPKSEFSFEEEPEPEQTPSSPSDDDKIAQEREFVRLKGMVNEVIGANPIYLKLISDDSILRRVISSNPLSLLTPEEQENLIDAEDAVDKIKTALEEKVSKEGGEKKEENEELEGKESPEGITEIPETPPTPEKPKKEGMAGVEDSIRAGIKE